MQELALAGETADVVFMDPPRAGSTRKFIDSLAAMRPKKVVYISCNPETLAATSTCSPRRATPCAVSAPVDMFPHTNHIETVVFLTQAHAK